MSRFSGMLTTLAAASTLVGVSVLPGAQAAVAAGNENMRISAYDIDYDLKRDGAVDVTENITVRFDDNSHHGLDRFIITAQGYNDEKHRVYPLTNVKVTSSTGAPSDVEKSADGGATRLRIGDADRTVSGVQKYTITYRLGGSQFDARLQWGQRLLRRRRLLRRWCERRRWRRLVT